MNLSNILRTNKVLRTGIVLQHLELATLVEVSYCLPTGILKIKGGINAIL